MVIGREAQELEIQEELTTPSPLKQYPVLWIVCGLLIVSNVAGTITVLSNPETLQKYVVGGSASTLRFAALIPLTALTGLGLMLSRKRTGYYVVAAAFLAVCVFDLTFGIVYHLFVACVGFLLLTYSFGKSQSYFLH